jgi:hypothetical protein
MLANIYFRVFLLLVCCTKKVNIKLCGTLISLLVWYGCEAWPDTLKQMHGLGMFKKQGVEKYIGI